MMNVERSCFVRLVNKRNSRRFVLSVMLGSSNSAVQLLSTPSPPISKEGWTKAGSVTAMPGPRLDLL